MRTDNEVHIIENAALGHGLSTAGSFFGRLKNQFDLAAELVCVVLNPLCDAKPDRKMTVMTAGMHEVGALRGITAGIGFVSRIGCFADLHAVNVEAKSGDGARPPKVPNANGAGKAVEFAEQLFTDALPFGSGNRLGDEKRIASHDEVWMDDGTSAADFELKAAQMIDNQCCRLKFGPAFFGASVNTAAKR